ERRRAWKPARDGGPDAVGGQRYASTGVGDVGQVVPAAGISTAAWVPGTPAHSWQAVAASGMSIGQRGALKAAAALAVAAVELFSDPELVRQARQEFEQRRGGVPYRPLLQRG